MQNPSRAGTVILVSNRRPDATVVQELAAQGFLVQWAASIEAAVALVSATRDRAVVATELALADGNWRDLLDQVRCIDKCIPFAVVTPSTTAELWWDALDCGVDDILRAPLTPSRLDQLLRL